MNISYITDQVDSPFQVRDSDKTAIKLESGKSWTYEDLNRISNKYGNQLRMLGIKKGDRVGILLYNCLEYFGLYFAIAKLGAIAVRLNFRLSSSELEYAINDSGVKLLCFHSDLCEKLEPIRKEVSVEKYVSLKNSDSELQKWAMSWDILKQGDTAEIEEDISPNDPVMLMYTSGTTGRPKGAIWTHNSTLLFSCMQIIKWNYTENQVSMTTGPLYHVGAMEDIALPTLMAGGSVIITQSKGFDISRVLKVIERERVTDCLVFPFMIYQMLNLSHLKQFDLSALNRIYTGGDNVLPWVIEKLNENFPHIKLIQMYGLTEGTPIAASIDPEVAINKSNSAGKPMPLTQIKIVNEEGQQVSPNEVGEIIIKSPAVSVGYWRNQEETDKTFKNGWCKTGDLGQYDEDGDLIISGRKKDMIRSGGENIYAAEIEDILCRHEAVMDVAIIGISDPKLIETVCAVVVKREDSEISEKELIDYCEQYLASYKKPRKVIFVDSLPRTASGKIQKFILREKYDSNYYNSTVL